MVKRDTSSELAGDCNRPLDLVLERRRKRRQWWWLPEPYESVLSIWSYFTLFICPTSIIHQSSNSNVLTFHTIFLSVTTHMNLIPPSLCSTNNKYPSPCLCLTDEYCLFVSISLPISTIRPRGFSRHWFLLKALPAKLSIIMSTPSGLCFRSSLS